MIPSVPDFSRFLPTAAVAVLAANLLVGGWLFFSRNREPQRAILHPQLSTLLDVMDHTHAWYVDPDKVGYDTLYQNAIQGVLSPLDPYSRHVKGLDLQEQTARDEGAFCGIGVVIGPHPEGLLISSVMPDMPAEKAGIKRGDIITSVDGQAVTRENFQQSVVALRGKENSDVTVTCKRNGADEPLEYTLKRQLIPLITVHDARLIPHTRIGYIAISEFAMNTARDFRKALDEIILPAKPAALIIDVRGNPGGDVIEAVNIAGFFLPKGTFIASREGRMGVRQYLSESGDFADSAALPLVILQNRFSASSAELLTGALQARQRATIIGETSYGKGISQSVYALPNGEELNLTTARVYLDPPDAPSPRRTVQNTGVKPDVAVEISEEIARTGMDLQTLQRAVQFLNEKANEQEDR